LIFSILYIYNKENERRKIILIKNIIWDFDGTLFNTYPEVSKIFKKTLEFFDIEESNTSILKNLHISLFYTFKIYSTQYNLDISQLKAQFTKLDEKMIPKQLKPFKGVENILKNKKITHFIYTHRGESTYKYLEHYNFLKYFKEIITREDKYLRKPDPQALIYLINKYNLKKEQTMYIGDRDIDIQCAINANIQSCYFDSHNIPSKEISNYTVSDYRQLVLK